MKKTIYLYGELAEKFIDKITVEADSVYKAISALRANFPEFEKFLIEYKPGFHLRTGTVYRSEETVHEPLGNNDLHLIPAISGSSGKIGAVFAVIIGVVLMMIPGMQVFGIKISAAALQAFGLGLAMAGISALLFAPPKPTGPNERPENTPNTYFNGAVNTIAQGHPVPVGYGELIIGSAVISAGLQSVTI